MRNSHRLNLEEHMRVQLGLMTAAVMALGIVGAAAQGADPKFVVTGPAAKELGEANQINAATAKAVVAACEKMAGEHNQGTAIIILDNFGNVVIQHRMDMASRRTAIQTAEMKARTALTTRRPTRLRQYNVEANPNLVGREFSMGYFPTAGGLPIWSRDQIIGFIGVGGMNATADWSDEICGHTALTQVIGAQPPLPVRPARRAAQ
jgi:uncharacterized protein GlcG (DUF336 family)